MHDLSVGQELPVREIVGVNFAKDSSNKMHSDETAARYGFKGGLVPGVGVYGYMAVPVVEALGRDWLEGGTLRGKFLKPVYDGDRVSVKCRVKSAAPPVIEIEVVNEEGTLCAVGEAGLPADGPELEVSGYARHPLPDEADRPPACADVMPAGMVLGSLEFTFETGSIVYHKVSELGEPLSIYEGPDGVCHPALVVAQANSILAANVLLGPWIHTASEVVYCGLPRDGEVLSLRGVVADSYVKRGHDFAVLDLALVGEEERPLALITHTAIVRPGLGVLPK